jgi:hypothetical protein
MALMPTLRACPAMVWVCPERCVESVTGGVNLTRGAFVHRKIAKSVITPSPAKVRRARKKRDTGHQASFCPFVQLVLVEYAGACVRCELSLVVGGKLEALAEGCANKLSSLERRCMFHCLHAIARMWHCVAEQGTSRPSTRRQIHRLCLRQRETALTIAACMHSVSLLQRCTNACHNGPS